MSRTCLSGKGLVWAAGAIVWVAVILMSGFMIGCGGGSGNNSTLPPSNLHYPESFISASVGKVITYTPTVTGTVSSYSISPALPAGLTINSSTGTISGTPMAASPKPSYTVTAANSAGSTTATISLTVIAPPSNLVYPNTDISAIVGKALTPNSPSVTGTVTAYSISPALPAGLTINSSTGTISGTPMAASPKTSYTVTAANSAGSTSATISVTVMVTPSNLQYPQKSIWAAIGTAITPDTPTVTGTVSAYSISPSLPPGLTIDTSTGAIAGTATGPALAQKSYTVTASSFAGFTHTFVNIAVGVPPSIVYPKTDVTATVGVALTLVPTITGSFDSLSISPALPAGLSFDAGHGTISGTPTAVSPKNTYTVKAVNSFGSGTATIFIAVIEAAPSNLVYPQTTIAAVVGTPITPDTPTISGTVSSYSISPDLPAGLAMNSSTGTISGTPTALSPKTSYTVTAANSTGSTTATLSITVGSPAHAIPVYVGHQFGAFVHFSADRLLSDDGLTWILWNYGTGEVVATGQRQWTREIMQPPIVSDIAGDVVVIATPAGLNVYSAINGQQISTITGTRVNEDLYRLATDGSYICSGSDSGLTVWSPDGTQEFALPGNYRNAKIAAMPGQVQVALGPAGSSVIETDSVPSGASTVSAPFLGTFNTWFIDGQRFLTNTGTTIWVYNKAAVQQSIMSLPAYDLSQQLIGQGNWISLVAAPTISVYAIGNTTPAATYAINVLDNPIPVGSYLAFLAYADPKMELIDLSGASPSAADYQLPDTMTYPFSFGANSNGQWIVEASYGVILDGATVSTTPRYFGYGGAVSIAGSSTNFAVATAIGKILLYNSAGDTQQGVIDFLSSHLQLSSDGSVLAASGFDRANQYYTDRTLNLYSLPSQMLTQSFPYTFDDTGTMPFLWDYSLSGSGQTLGRVLVGIGGASSSREVTPLSGSPVTWSDSGVEGPLVLSPGGANFAAADQYLGDAAPTTNLWNNDTLTGAIPGLPEGWIDDTHLLAANYSAAGSGPVYLGSTIYDPAGNVLSTIPGGTRFPEIRKPYFLSSDLVYDPGTNAVYSLSTGAAVWTAPPVNGVALPFRGTVSGSNIVYVGGSQIFVAPGPH